LRRPRTSSASASPGSCTEETSIKSALIGCVAAILVAKVNENTHGLYYFHLMKDMEKYGKSWKNTDFLQYSFQDFQAFPFAL
jgi:hypothetical protein